jgi:hypothetical protein
MNPFRVASAKWTGIMTPDLKSKGLLYLDAVMVKSDEHKFTNVCLESLTVLNLLAVSKFLISFPSRTILRNKHLLCDPCLPEQRLFKTSVVAGADRRRRVQLLMSDLRVLRVRWVRWVRWGSMKADSRREKRCRILCG